MGVSGLVQYKRGRLLGIGQIASAKVAMARLSSPQLYCALSASDFSLDINNPEAPKVV